ncbi:argininosuccinate lyase [Leucobacter sp. wl10]|uniref:argininosuccinate lyase n=1 Tax=Leucobacter sp. wl10 TaxID=2304677 RepID=UPI000E5B5974|nr:argininosuccinate lyase [Leucobacter sp. wl10]RGE20366.1 argininosuccinate lyase [Leucobacter sp. wl10]
MNHNNAGGVHDDGKLWGGRFTDGPDPALERISRSPRRYFDLAPEDIQGSIAHLGELERCGVVTAEERAELAAALRRIGEDHVSGAIAPTDADEDVHGYLERALIERVGSVGGKIRAGRSRNDQTSNDLRLWLRRRIDEIAARLGQLVETLIERSEDAGDAIVPGFTHLQPAQPVLFGHQLLAHAQTLARDLRRLAAAREAVSLSPLGAAALAGSSFHGDQVAMARELGYRDVIANSIDAVGSRDHVIDFLYAGASIGTNLSRLSDELILWGSQQFGWIRLHDAWSTGSSIMPQKKNPDIPELTRGKASRLQANLTGMLGVMKSVPFSYNRDFSEDKHYAFDTSDLLDEVLPAITGFVRTMSFVPERMAEQAAQGFTLATELADWVAEQGIPFSEAHDITGRAVVVCEQRGIGIEDLSASDLASIDSRITADVLERLTLESAVSRRSGGNGTAPSRQGAQRERLRREIAEYQAAFAPKEEQA